MAAEVERHRDSAVSKEILYHLPMGALFQQERRCRVSQIAHAQSGKARPVEVVMKCGIYPARIQRATCQRREYEAMLTPGFTSAPPDVFNHIPVRLKHVPRALRQSNCSTTSGCLRLNEQQAWPFCRCTLRCTVATPRTKSTSFQLTSAEIHDVLLRAPVSGGAPSALGR
jgi:hypothetical protein